MIQSREVTRRRAGYSHAGGGPATGRAASRSGTDAAPAACARSSAGPRIAAARLRRAGRRSSRRRATCVGRRAHRRALRRRPGSAATSPRMYARAHRRRARAHVRSAAFARAYRRALRTATARARARRRAGATTATSWRLPVRVEHARLRDRAAATSASRSRTADEPASPGAPSWPSPACGAASGCAARRAAAARDAARARQHACWRAARTAARRSAASPASIVGSSARSPRTGERELRELGVPADAQVGISGLERIFDARLLGRPGGELRAGDRVLGPRRRARRRAGAHDDLRSTSSARRSRRSRARLGGVVALDPRSGAVLGVAGHRLLGPAAAGLDVQDHHAGRRARGRHHEPRAARYPVQTEADARGRRARERQRRVLRRHARRRPSPSRATRCSRRSAPSSARAGSSSVAERFGFNDAAGDPRRGDEHDPRRRARSATTWPSARRRSARGACRPPRCRWRDRRRRSRGAGARPAPTLDLERGRRAAPHGRRVTTPRIARTVERMMLAVVREGTGTRGGDPGRAGRGQDRHGRAAHDRALRARPGEPGGLPARARARTTRPTPTPGSPPTRRPATAARAWRSACCSSARAPAATPRRPPRAPSCSRGCAAAADRAARDLDVEVDGDRAVGVAGSWISSSSGRFSRFAMGILKSSSEPWIVCSAGGGPGAGRIWSAGISTGR